jgi:hypothetical protein
LCRHDPYHGENLARAVHAEQAGSDARVGLLRLQAGIGTPDDLTADLEAADQIGQDVDALLSAKREAGDVVQ